MSSLTIGYGQPRVVGQFFYVFTEMIGELLYGFWGRGGIMVKNETGCCLYSRSKFIAVGPTCAAHVVLF